MDITPQDTTQQPISDDQELAQALAGVLPDEAEPAQQEATPALQFEEIAAPTPPPAPVEAPAAPAAVEPPMPPVVPENEATVASDTDTTVADPALESIKKDALEELRPLMDKVNLPPEEKFNTYLMLIRSTDDATLIEPAHAAALNIPDDSVRAQALLDIIKEIDYLSHDKSAAS